MAAREEKKEARMEWDGVGHGDRKSSKDSQVGRLPSLACPRGQLGPPFGGYEGADVMWVSAGGGSISPAFSSTPRALLRVQI